MLPGGIFCASALPSCICDFDDSPGAAPRRRRRCAIPLECCAPTDLAEIGMAAKKRESARSRRRDTPNLRLHGNIARDVGVRIVSGRHKPGFLLENEIAASERLGVSRTAYREAVRILNAKGLVHSRPKVGTRVSGPENWQLLDPDVLSWLFEFDPNDKLLEDLFELRKMVEPQAAALAATRRTEDQLETMRRALADMGKHTLATNEGRLADRHFHLTLLQASDNAFLMTLASGIAAAITWTTVYKQRENPSPRDPLPDHTQVYRAIAAGNAKRARKAMHDLLELALSDTKISLRHSTSK
jgi:DNA-binding FadR family transcriptional regulator